jgi:hypothetical protein
MREGFSPLEAPRFGVPFVFRRFVVAGRDYVKSAKSEVDISDREFAGFIKCGKYIVACSKFSTSLCFSWIGPEASVVSSGFVSGMPLSGVGFV